MRDNIVFWVICGLFFTWLWTGDRGGSAWAWGFIPALAMLGYLRIVRVIDARSASRRPRQDSSQKADPGDTDRRG